eukprot:TRINITY_DN19777_c0_g1_i1.p1 TRINITY_DN19777_c0_g1~~TRINITY_DN19777_c0_g1_i1.p1  ORF type:complete len:338 (-),score=81.31 TRINITY_DN19777_c0_g1_i1:237-1184(-)
MAASVVSLSKVQSLHAIGAFVPKMSHSMHKGQSGKVGIVGGSLEYTGAPYYSGISALKVGADIAHIFCGESAAIPIKSYSPELIVHPTFKEKSGDEKQIDQMIEKMVPWLKGLSSLVIGPGLGRDDFVAECTKRIIKEAKQIQLPLIIDGDGLMIINKDIGIISGYKKALLTPNVVEYKRLCEATGIKEDDNNLSELCQKLGGVTILRKGKHDQVSNGEMLLTTDSEGSPRRCGGQGDVLTGASAALLAWAHLYEKNEKSLDYPATILAAYGGSLILRESSRLAFNDHHRGTTTPDIIGHLADVVEHYFPCGLHL